jgi:hypothetical protein
VKAIPGGYRVSWGWVIGGSRFRVNRRSTDGIRSVELQGLADHYDDLVSPPWPVTRYTLTVALFTGAGATSDVTSDPVQVPAFSLLGGPTTFQATGPVLPLGSLVAMDSQNRPHVADEGMDPTRRIGPAIYRAAGTGYDRYPVEDALWRSGTGWPVFAVPPMAFDGGDHLHAAYIRQVIGAPTAIVHVWHDGSAWHQEDVATTQLSNAVYGFWFGVATDGAVHVCWDEDPLSAAGMIHMVKRDGAWSREIVPTGETHVDAWFGLGPDGTAYYYQLSLLLAQDPGGAWTPIQLPPIDWGLYMNLWLAPATKGHLSLVWEAFKTPGPLYSQFWFTQQTPTGWTTEELAFERPTSGGMTPLVIASTPGGERVHIMVTNPHQPLSTEGTTDLWGRTPAGWLAMYMGPSEVNQFWLGFSPEGKAWVVVPGLVEAETASFNVYRE